MSINYNVLDRTDQITVTAGTNQYINYTYDADGNLIRKQAYNNGSLQTTDYIDGFVYLSTGTGAAALSYFPMPEGRVINNAGTLVQEFIIADAQGNARLSFQNNGFGVPVVKQENSYYPFGLIMPNSPVAMPALPNKKLYNGGSEWQNDYSNSTSSLPDYYQTYNRNYDAALGRFVAVDPEASNAESMSSYQYAENNPIMLNDPLGNLPPNRRPPRRLPLGNFADLTQIFDDGDGEEGVYASDPDQAWFLGKAMATNIYNANDPNSILNFDQMTAWLSGQGVSASNATIGQPGVITISGYDIKAPHDPVPIMLIKNNYIEVDIQTGLFAPFNSLTLATNDPIVVDLTPMEDPGGPYDAYIVTIGGDIVTGLGFGRSFSVIAITNGDETGIYLYENKDNFVGWDISGYAEAGGVQSNTGKPLHKASFIGTSQSYNIGAEGGSINTVVGFSDNKFHPSYPSGDAPVEFSGVLRGVNWGADLWTVFSGSIGFSSSTFEKTILTW